MDKATERAAIEHELAFYEDVAPPEFMREAIAQRKAKLRARLQELVDGVIGRSSLAGEIGA